MSSKYYEQAYPTWNLEAIPRDQKKWLSFLSLRFGTVLCSMVGIICFAWAYVQHEKGVAYTDGIGSGFSIFNTGVAAYAFVWSTTFLTLILRGCTIHPGISIAFDCIAFLAQIIPIAMDLNEFATYHAGGYGESGTLDDRLYGVECFGCAVMLLGVLFYGVLVVQASMVCHAMQMSGKEDDKSSFENV